MVKVRIAVDELVSFLGSDIIKLYGAYSGVFIDNLADTSHINCHTLDWVIESKDNKQEIVEKSKARVLLVDSQIEYTEKIAAQSKVLIVVNHPKIALAKIGNHYFVPRPKKEIHPSAIIDIEAKLGEGISIGPYTVIGKAIIGNNCVIDSNVRIYDNVTIGDHCIIKAGAVLGGEGFGFEKDSEGNRFRFPQIGGLVLGHHVEIGANTCVDRGALSDTIIGNYTKINNLCHIAHNNVIGDNVEITGCVNVSGSNVIDNDVWIAPNSTIRGYLHIGEKAVVGMGAVVTKNIPCGEIWIGNPAHKLGK